MVKRFEQLTDDMRRVDTSIVWWLCRGQQGRSHLSRLALALVGSLLIHSVWPASTSQAQSGGAIQMKASRVEANSNTGVVTAIGNVRIDYPSRQIYATSAQAQYYSNEQKIILSGSVDVLQEGNSLRAETVTYLIEEGRFVRRPMKMSRWRRCTFCQSRLRPVRAYLKRRNLWLSPPCLMSCLLI